MILLFLRSRTYTALSTFIITSDTKLVNSRLRKGNKAQANGIHCFRNLADFFA